MTHVIRTLGVEEAVGRWAEFEPMLRKATDLTLGCYKPFDVLGLAMAGRFGLLIAEENGRADAIVATEIQQFPQMRILHVWFVAGEHMECWLQQMFAEVSKVAQKYECKRLTGSMRKGWARLLDMEITSVNFMRDI